MISRENNFDLLRLFAAMQVVLGHISVHQHVNFREGLLNAFPGVLMFFVMSGFLIASSFDRNKDLKKYLRNRILRIYPALIFAFLLIFIALLVFGYINKESIQTIGLWTWIVGQVSLFQFYTPDVLRGFGVGTPNGSLWTIPVEFIFYLLLPGLLYIFKSKKNIGLGICLVLSIIANWWLTKCNDDLVWVKLLTCSVIPWFYIFALGVLLYFNWDRLKYFFENKFFYYLVVYLLYFYFVSGPSYYITGIDKLVANVLLCLLTISAGYTFPKLGGYLRGVDISYGIYVYHMIVVNIFVELSWVGKSHFGIISLLLTILLALFSWFCIESRALSLKK